jgi:hypothetical protein
VARDSEDSGLGTSAFARPKRARRNREIASCDGSHGDGEEDRWPQDRHLGTRVSPFTRTRHREAISEGTVDHRGSGFRCLIARGHYRKPRDIARSDLPIREEEIAEKTVGERLPRELEEL